MCDIQGLQNSPSVTAKTDPGWTANDRFVIRCRQSLIKLKSPLAAIRSQMRRLTIRNVGFENANGRNRLFPSVDALNQLNATVVVTGAVGLD